MLLALCSNAKHYLNKNVEDALKMVYKLNFFLQQYALYLPFRLLPKVFKIKINIEKAFRRSLFPSSENHNLVDCQEKQNVCAWPEEGTIPLGGSPFIKEPKKVEVPKLQLRI